MKSIHTLTALILVLLLANVASADVMHLDGMGFREVVKIHAPATAADGLRVWAGEYEIAYQDAFYIGYCVDLSQESGSSTVTEMGALDLPNGDLISYLFDTYRDTIDSNRKAAGLQVAIWEVLTETDDVFDAGEGSFRISRNDGAITQANSYLATLPASYQPEFQPTVLVSECRQDVLIGQYGQVPEPATLATLGLSGLALLIRRIRR